MFDPGDPMVNVVTEARRLPIPSEPGLIVARADNSLSPGSSGDWTRHVAVYVTSDEYAPRFVAQKGEQYTSDGWHDALLASASKGDLLRALTVATHVVSEGGDALRAWTAHVIDGVEPVLAGCIQAALSKPGADRVLLARQPLLMALKVILAEGRDAPVGRGRDPFIVLTMLTHHVSRDAGIDRGLSAGERLGGFDAPMAMELVRNSAFNETDDYGDLLARTRQLWTAYEGQIERYPPRRPLRDMLREATLLDLDDMTSLAFAIYSQTIKARIGNVPMLDVACLGFPQSVVDAFLARFTVTEVELAELLEGEPGSWQFSALENRPLLRLGRTEVAVIDERMLQKRFTTGLYWIVHDHERDTHGDGARRDWTQTFSELIEMHAEGILRRLSPPLLGVGSSFFAEEQLRMMGGKAVDCGVDFGSTVLLCDIVKHSLTLQTRQLGDVARFEADMEKAVMKKVAQLDGTIERLVTSTVHKNNPLGRRPASVLPMVVQGGEFPVMPATMTFARDEATKRGLLQQEGVLPLIVVTIAELEMLEALANAGRAVVVDVLRDYAVTDGLGGLRNFIIDNYGGSTLHRSDATQSALDEQFDVVMDRLKHLDAGRIGAASVDPGSVPSGAAQ
jgi:hypothetical protein